MSFLITPATSIYVVVRLNGTTITTLSDVDIEVEAFEAHKSLCSDTYYRYGGCVAEHVTFTTSKMYYDNGGVSTLIPWDKVSLVISFGYPNPADPDYSIMSEFGVYIGKEFEANTNHTMVTVTAYDLMYTLCSLDVTSWYEGYVSTYPNGHDLSGFFSDFKTHVNSRMTGTYFGGWNNIDLMQNVYFTHRAFWTQKPTVIVDGQAQYKTLFDGTVTAGQILKGICVACGVNAFMGMNTAQSPGTQGRYVNFFDIGLYSTKSLTTSDYSKLKYSLFDTTPFDNVRLAVYDTLWNAVNTTGMTYGIADNFVFNSMSEIVSFDDPYVPDGEYVLQAIPGMLLTKMTAINSGVYRPMTISTFGSNSRIEVGTGIDITAPDGNTYRGIVMQRDLRGIVGMSADLTCLPTENYFTQGDYTDEDTTASNLSDLSGKVSITNDNVSSTVTWELKPSGWDVKKGGSTVMKVNSSGLSLDAVSIKKNGTELAPVAISGSYNDLTDQPDGLFFQGSIAANTDFNTILTTGIYKGDAANGYANCPVSRHLTMLVCPARTGGVVQILVDDANTNSPVWVRRSGNNAASWLSWERLATANELPTKLSDLTDDVVNGYYVKLTNNGYQTITNSITGTRIVLDIKSSASNGVLLTMEDATGVLGSYGVNPSKKPIFRDTADHLLALAEEVIAHSDGTRKVICSGQVASMTGSSVTITLPVTYIGNYVMIATQHSDWTTASVLRPFAVAYKSSSQFIIFTNASGYSVDWITIGVT